MQDKYKQLLDLFILKVENDQYNQIWQRLPFTFDDKIAATNGRSMVIIPSKKVTSRIEIFRDESKQMNEVKKYSRNLWIEIPVSWLRKAVERIPMLSASCPACEGRGQVTWEFMHINQYHERIDDCPVCDGYGVRDRFDNVFDGKVYSKNEGVKIGHHIFRGNVLMELIKAADILKADVITMISQTKKYNKTVFKIGDVEVFSMPFSSQTKAVGCADLTDFLKGGSNG